MNDTCDGCGAILGPDYTVIETGAHCPNCVDHPDAPATGERIYLLETDR
ncbi:hypothetical protein PXH67_06415 [Streptomyces sp. P8-A8]